MKELLYIDCRTTKIKVISINGQSEKSKVLPRANENSDQNKQTATGVKTVRYKVESCQSLHMRLVEELAQGFFISLRGHLKEVFSGGSTKGAEQHSNLIGI